jgi:peptide deformylase
MTTRSIVIYPDPRLRAKAQPVASYDPALQRLVKDLLETMRVANGLGLAATQIAELHRVFVMDVSEDGSCPIAFVNPVIVSRKGQQKRQEGCLSIPGVYADVVRAAEIRVQASDPLGRQFEKTAVALEAVCIQHEIDHLDGRLFIDHLSPLKRERVLESLRSSGPQSASGTS